MIYGQWLDYLGPAHNYPLAIKMAAALEPRLWSALWLVFGRAAERDRNEPIRLLVAWIGLPALAFIARVGDPAPDVQSAVPCAGDRGDRRC